MSPRSGITQELASWTSSVRWQDAPAHVQDNVVRMLSDCLGVALTGSVGEEFELLRHVETEHLASEGKLLPMSEAMLLSTAAHALDFDDIHLPMGGHPSSVVVGGVVAAARSGGASSGETWAGFLAGVETAARVGRAISEGHYHVGWHPTSVIGALASAAAVSRVMGLDTQSTQRALGLAAAMASGTKANFGTFSKPMQVGHASRAGLSAATYAAAGISASATILDDQHGAFTRLFTEKVDEDAITADLGRRYSIVDPEPVIKLIPACGGVHAATWAAIELSDEHQLRASEISSVDVEVHAKRIPHTDRPTVNTGLEGKFSTQYCVAVGLTQRSVTLADFEPERLHEEARQQVLGRTRLREAADADTWPGSDQYATGARGARITVETVDGRSLTTFLAAAPGYPGNPASDARVRDKFLDCAARVVDAGAAAGWVDALLEDRENPPLAPLLEISDTVGLRAGSTGR